MARSKAFDERLVLSKAMELFWKQGYEKTSMQELVDYMGIHRKSIYDTYGDKKALFQASLNQYETFVKGTLTDIVNSSTSVKQAIFNIFNFVIKPSEFESYPTGCLTVNAAVELSLIDQEINQYVTKTFKDTEQLFEDLLESGQKNGEISEQLNPHMTAKLLHNNLVGLRVLVKTNYSKTELESTVNLLMKVLD